MRGEDQRDAVLLDTNALMAVGALGIDMFDELGRVAPGLEPVVPTGVVEELRRIEIEGTATEARNASVALALVEGTARVSTEGRVDDALVELAEERGWEVLTNDAELINRLKVRGLPVIYIRQKSYLQRSLD
ncbi:MAG: Ribonuclease VapC9 [Methanonatronarchaeales archaeon]|nr:Ribonuclease VapC9 [Methanonatronarchaeales archaeon]